MAESTGITIISRAEAKARGLTRYFTGKPCARRHRADRLVSNGACRACKIETQREYRAGNPEKYKESGRKWRADNPEYFRDYFRENQDRSRELSRAWKLANPERTKKINRDSILRTPGIAAFRAKRWRDANPEKTKEIRKRCYVRRMMDPRHKIDASIRTGLSGSIAKGGKHGKKTYEALGYNRRDLMAHLEKKFTEGMTWDNYGDWHIDHVIPLSAFNFSTVDCHDFKRAWALSNLQPLWAFDNLSKNAKLEKPFQPSLL